jgi:hypothetical protein
VAPLLWDVPGAWARLDAPPSGSTKAVYRVSPAGSDAEPGEAQISFFGTGTKGDPAQRFEEWFHRFDGEVGATAARDAFRAHDLAVETVEVSGTYKIALTPAPPGRRAPGVQMVKKRWRLLGAVVRTKDRGNWFFELTGPDETVQARRSAFRWMLESAR